MAIEYTDDDRKKDFDFFLSNYDVFYKKYGNCYIAIRKNKIIGVFKEEKQALDIASSEFGYGNFIVQKCNGDETGYTNYITSFQLIKI